MMLQLAEGGKPTRKRKDAAYIHLPKKKVLVREDYFDRISLNEMAAELSENGYSPTEISELAGKRAARKASAPARSAAPAASAPKRSILPGSARRQEKKTEKAAFKTAKREQKIAKKAAKTAVKSARAQKKIDTGAAKKTRAQARVIKAQRQEPSEQEELFNTVVNNAADFIPEPEFSPEYTEDTDYVPNYSDEEEAEYIETEEVTPEEMAENVKQSRKAKIKGALIKGLKTAAVAYQDSGKKPAATVKLPKQTPPPQKKEFWNDPIFNVGKFEVTPKKAAIGGTLLFFTGLAIKKLK